MNSERIETNARELARRMKARESLRLGTIPVSEWHETLFRAMEIYNDEGD